MSVVEPPRGYSPHWAEAFLMDGGMFYMFLEERVFGAQFLVKDEPVNLASAARCTPIVPWTHLSYTTTIRRDPFSAEIRSQDPIIVLDMDRVPSPFELPASVWEYAFETIPGHFKITPRATVKVVFASAQRGIIVKVPATTLLVLAQEKCSLKEVSTANLAALAKAWQEWVGIEGRQSLTILVRDEKVQELFDIATKSPTHPVKALVEEAWAFRVAATRAGTGPGGAMGKIDAKTAIFYAWAPLYLRDDHTRQLQADWVTSGRVRSSDRFMDGFFVKDDWPGIKRVQTPSVKWSDLGISFLPGRAPPTSPRLPPAPITVRPLPCDIAGYTPHWRHKDDEDNMAVTRFRQAYRDLWNIDLEVLMWRPGAWIFKEPSPTGTRDRPCNVILADDSFPASARGYSFNLQVYLDTGTPDGIPFRYFDFDLDIECLVERVPATIRAATGAQLATDPLVREVAPRVLHLRNSARLNVDLVMGNFLGALEFPRGDTIVDVWAPHPETGRYERVFQTPNDREIYETFMGLTPQPVLHPIFADIAAKKFAKECEQMTQTNLVLTQLLCRACPELGAEEEEYEEEEEEDDDGEGEGEGDADQGEGNSQGFD